MTKIIGSVMLTLRVFAFCVTLGFFVFLMIAYWGGIISLELLAPLFAVGAGLAASIGRFPSDFDNNSVLNRFISYDYSWMIWAFSGMAAFVWFVDALTVEEEMWGLLLLVPIFVISITIIGNLIWTIYKWPKRDQA